MDQIKVELQEVFGSDRSIAESAWTSSLTLQGKEKRSEADVEKIVKMLAESKHSTPFESVIFKFWIKMPIQTDRQHMTHRIASHNGMSGRYRTMPNEYFDMPDDVLEISNKIIYRNVVQIIDKLGNHTGTSFNTDFDNIYEAYVQTCETSNLSYTHIIELAKSAEKENKISNKEYKRLREFFRGVLPQNNMTERVTIMNLRSFANYQKLRNSEHAQPEIQQVAKLMLEEVKKVSNCPIAIESLQKEGWNI